MEFTVIKTKLADIESHRRLFLAETKFQFIYNKCHGAGWADVYRFLLDETPVGYGSVWGEHKREERDTIFEFFLDQPFRKYAREIMALFIKTAGTGFINSRPMIFYWPILHSSRQRISMLTPFCSKTRMKPHS